MDNIIEKIRKLLAVTREAGASDNEADQALRLAQALMLKHGIENVDNKPSTLRGPTITELTGKHHSIIAGQVSKLYSTVPVYLAEQRDHFYFVGREENVAASILTTELLCDQIDVHYRSALPKGLSQAERAQWRKDFKIACAIKLARRIDAIIENLAQNSESLTGSTALVVLTHREQLLAEARSAIEGTTSPVQSKAVRVNLTEAALKGSIAGELIDINQKVRV